MPAAVFQEKKSDLPFFVLAFKDSLSPLLNGTVSVMDILRTYAEVYVKASFFIGMMCGDKDSLNKDAAGILSRDLKNLEKECIKCELVCTLDMVRTLIEISDHPEVWPRLSIILPAKLEELNGRLESELSHRLFLHLRSDRRKYYDEPRDGWEEVISRFGSTVSDIEEMSRCFALSRYAASVYHSTQVIELGLIELGKLVSVKDPLSGFTAVSKALENIVVKKTYDERSEFERTHFKFLEQMHGTVVGIKNAWRNKIDHAQNKLVLMTPDFSPDVAEEIILATRAFMRRLVTEMP